jgi:hypothetical protein
MKKIKLLPVVGVLAFIACTNENTPAVWNTAEVSSASVIPETSSCSSTEMAAQSSSSSSTGNVVQPSSSELSSASKAVADTVWHQANLTWYTSWPEPGSEECIEYNGCTWAGYFAGVEGQKSEEWVKEHNIIAVHEKDWNKYKLKTFRLRMNGSTIDAVVYDMCSDSDCDGCCTENAGEIGFLIDIEKYTRERFDGNGDGVVEWTCLDCE